MKRKTKNIIAFVLSASLCLSLLPIGFSRDDSSSNISIETNKAHAVAPAVVPALAFLSQVAAAAGLTDAQLVATVVGISTVSTGMSFATSEGVRMGGSLSDNLGHLIEAADYPDFETLSAEDKAAWGSKDNYNAAKFNELLDAFDLGDARDGFYSSGGNNFEFSDNAQERLLQIGGIASNWAIGGANTVEDLIACMNPDYESIMMRYYGVSSTVSVGANEYAGWPSGYPNVNVSKGTLLYFEDRKSSEQRTVYYQRATGSDVYWIFWKAGTSTQTQAFSKDAFMYGYNQKSINDSSVGSDNPQLDPPSINKNSVSVTVDGSTIYLGAGVSNAVDSLRNNNMPITEITSSQLTNSNNLNKIYKLILYGPTLPLGELPQDVDGYPADIIGQPDDEVYYPTSGVSPSQTWDDYLTEQEPDYPSGDNPDTGNADLDEIIRILRKFQWYANGNLKVFDFQLHQDFLNALRILNRFTFDAVGNLYVYDRHVESVLNSLLSAFQGFLSGSIYQNGEVKVHDAGNFDQLTDVNTELDNISRLLSSIQSTLTNWFGVDTATDVIGEVDFDELGDKATDLVDTISSLAPFGALLMMSEMLTIISQTGSLQTPSLVFDFDFMPDNHQTLTLDLSWVADLKPVINVFCIITLLVGLYGATVRLIELEAAS